MSQVEIADAEADLRALILRAEAGEDVRLVEGGKERARLVVSPLAVGTLPRWGVLRGQVRVPMNIDAPLPDGVLDLFEGR